MQCVILKWSLAHWQYSKKKRFWGIKITLKKLQGSWAQRYSHFNKLGNVLSCVFFLILPNQWISHSTGWIRDYAALGIMLGWVLSYLLTRFIIRHFAGDAIFPNTKTTHIKMPFLCFLTIKSHHVLSVNDNQKAFILIITRSSWFDIKKNFYWTFNTVKCMFSKKMY